MKHGHTHGIAIGAYHLLKWQVSVFTLTDNPLKTYRWPSATGWILTNGSVLISFFLLCQISFFFATPFFPICRHTTIAVHTTRHNSTMPSANAMHVSWKEEKKNQNMSSADDADTLDWMCSWWSCILNTWRSSLTLFRSLLHQNKWHFLQKSQTINFK